MLIFLYNLKWQNILLAFFLCTAMYRYTSLDKCSRSLSSSEKAPVSPHFKLTATTYLKINSNTRELDGTIIFGKKISSYVIKKFWHIYETTTSVSKY